SGGTCGRRTEKGWPVALFLSRLAQDAPLISESRHGSRRCRYRIASCPRRASLARIVHAAASPLSSVWLFFLRASAEVVPRARSGLPASPDGRPGRSGLLPEAASDLPWE